MSGESLTSQRPLSTDKIAQFRKQLVCSNAKNSVTPEEKNMTSVPLICTRLNARIPRRMPSKGYPAYAGGHCLTTD